MTNTQKTILIAGGTIFLLLIVPLLFVSQQETPQHKIKTEKMETDKIERNQYPMGEKDQETSEFKKQYMQGCAGEREERMTDYCLCTYQFLTENYSKNRIMDLGLKLMENEIDGVPHEMREAMDACIGEINY